VDHSIRVKGMNIKARRKGLGWSRQELARRAGIDPLVIQQLELGSWSEGGARMRVEVVLDRAEGGELDVQLAAHEVPPGAATPGQDGTG
jgi:transcriptional regulator with XRE-family HTH domain